VIFLTSNTKNIEADFKPEVLGRLDSIVDFNKLDKSVMTSLVVKQIELLKNRLKSKKIEAIFSDQAISHIAELGFSDKYGARPLQSTFNRLVIRPLSKILLAGEERESVKVDLIDGEIKIS
jgi:ATP-dependent Clp protease ATP-binding subunit ClpB